MGINGDRIIAVAPEVEGPAKRTIDLAGGLLLPAFIDAHLHIDRAFTGGPGGLPQSLHEAAVRWRETKAYHTGPDIITRGRKLLDGLLRFGTAAVRAHTDVDGIVGTASVEALEALRQEYADRMTIQIVAFPPSGSIPWTSAGRQLLARALRAGADVLGGLPNFDDNPRRHIDALLELAQEHGCSLDVHIDEGPPEQGVWVEYLAEQTVARGLAGRVTASHCSALGALPESDAGRIIEKMQAARLGVVALPSTNLYLRQRTPQGPAWQGITRIRALRSAGIPVALGSDNIQDVFYPYGEGDMLDSALLAALAVGYEPNELPDLLAMVTGEAALVLGLPDRRIAPGGSADLVAFPPGIALPAERPLPRVVITLGRVLSLV